MTTTQNPLALEACLSRGAWKTGMPGSEGAGTQQCVPATRRFHIQWRRKRGTNQWYVYTFIADRPLNTVKDKIRAMTHRVSQADPRTILTRINQILRGWTNYFRHAVCKHTLNHLRHFVNWRVIRWLRRLHHWRWREFRRRFTTTSGQWLPLSMNGIELFNPASVPVTRYRYRGTIPTPWAKPNHA